MTAHERVRVIVEFGFTERQARFLELVMRHAGVCVPRQYARFAGIAHGGAKCNAFFDKLVRRGCAVRSDCLHNRARLYHVHHKPLYQAIGESESRFRRPVPARRAVERLMLLDAVLASPDLHWLTTEAEKVSYLAALTPPEAVNDSPNSSADAGLARLARPFSSAFPIGIAASGQAVVFYLATVPWTDEFRTFVQAHTEFLHRVGSWALRLVFPRPLDRVYHAYQQVIHEELETPLHHATIAELKSGSSDRQPRPEHASRRNQLGSLPRSAVPHDDSIPSIRRQHQSKGGNETRSPDRRSRRAGPVGRVLRDERRRS
ncbi:MAG TPA: hypothetical protein VI485_26510 [Vicinamibacterales bacterium]|nr:hypothetical protein [Vicinamibacterales bacterium]